MEKQSCGFRGVATKALKESSRNENPCFARTRDRPFRPITVVVTKNRLKGSVDDVIDKASNFVTNRAPIKPIFN